MLKLFTILIALANATCASAWPWPTPIHEDTKVGALEAGDYTALVEGCGNQLVPGYTYCRVTEGSTADASLYFVGPAVKCANPDTCVTFKVYFPAGTPSYGGAIPKGKTRVAVPWSVLLGRTTFEAADRGFWPFTVEIHYTGSDGKDYVSLSEGEIRMRVVSSDYVPLQNVSGDANFQWKWTEKDGVTVKMTTKQRTYVSPKP